MTVLCVSNAALSTVPGIEHLLGEVLGVLALDD